MPAQQQPRKSVSFTLDQDDFLFEDDDEPKTSTHNNNNFSSSSFYDDSDDDDDGNRSPILTSASSSNPQRQQQPNCSPELNFDDDLDDDDAMNSSEQYNYNENNLSQTLSDIVDEDRAVVATDKRKVKSEIDELFEEQEREEEENRITSVKSPILSVRFTANPSSSQFTYSSPVSSPPGLSQYQKEQRNVYQYDDINELPSTTLSQPSSPKISQPIINEIVQTTINNTMQDEEEEESAFHKLDPSVKCNSEVTISNNDSTIMPITLQNNTTTRPTSPTVATQQQQQPTSDNTKIIVTSKPPNTTPSQQQPTTIPDSQEIDIDFSQLEEALNETPITPSVNNQSSSTTINNIVGEPSTPKSSSLIEISRSKITTSSPQKKKPLKFVQQQQQQPSHKDDIICTPEFSAPLSLVHNMDDIENSENSQMDAVKIEPRPPSSPSKPLSWREAIYKSNNRHSISPQKIIQPEKELVSIKDYFGLTTFQRGNIYAGEDRIYEMNADSIEVQEGDELTFLSSKCWGASEVPYQQSIAFEEKTMSIRKCTCSCPVETNCKHSCASLITWLNCKKKSVPYPTLDSVGKQLENVLSEMNNLRKELEQVKKENEILKSSANSDYSSGSEDFDATTPTKNHCSHGGFVSYSNNLDKTPTKDPSLLPSFISPSPASVDNSSLKRKRTDFTLDPNTTKKVK